MRTAWRRLGAITPTTAGFSGASFVLSALRLLDLRGPSEVSDAGLIPQAGFDVGGKLLPFNRLRRREERRQGSQGLER